MSALPQLGPSPAFGTKAAALQETGSFRYLEPDEYPVWDALVVQSPQRSVFCRSWWLQAVGDVRVLGYFDGKDLVAGIPLYFERRYGIQVCTLPRLTQVLGPVMRPISGKPVTITARENKTLRAFAGVLSGFRLFFQAFHPSVTNWLPFYWAGFRQTTRYTHVVEGLSDLQRVWDAMSTATRGQIQKAQRAGFEFVPCGIEDVFRCEHASYIRHGSRPTHTESVLKAIHQAAMRNDCAACFGMADRSGKLHCAWLLVWDGTRTYQLAGGIAGDTRSAGANSLGVWRAIQFAAERTLTYDFVGSMMEGVGRFNRGFGARQLPYSFIVKVPPPLHCCLQLAGKL